MKLSLTWLKEYTKYNLSTDELVDRLIMTTAEVEQVIKAPLSIKEATTAKILKITKHPNADRLSIVTINTATGKQKVVCGAKNIQEGDKVPYIKAGGHFNENDQQIILKKANIRGITSSGMLASERDLGFSTKHEGIMQLDKKAKIGQQISNYLEWDDPVLDLEITPNRGDLQSYIGLAREIAVICKSRINLPIVNGFSIEPKDSSPMLRVSVDTEDCSRYITVVVNEIINCESPQWLKNRLILNDIEPINAVVDITNYVMLEFGQPMHAFDWHKLKVSNNKDIPELTVRKAKEKETIETLDGTVISLSTKDTVIANKTPIAIAGVIGGFNTRVSLGTTKIVLEAAIFDAANTRKTAQRHGIRTESLVRFEKGIDEEQTMVAVKRVLALIKEITNGKPIGRLTDINHQNSKKERLNVSLDRAEKILGTNIERTKIKSYLSSIGFQVSTVSQNRISVLIPSWRKDVSIEEDIYEEISRMHGYDKIEPTLPGGSINPQNLDNSYYFQKKLRRSLVKAGFKDIVTQAFISSNNAQKYGYNINRLVEIENPTSINEQYLRPSLTTALIERSSAQSREQQQLKSFEIGNVFIKNSKSYKEKTKVGLCILATDYLLAASALKTALINAMSAMEMGIKLTFSSNTKSQTDYLSNNVEEIFINGKLVGELGVLQPRIIAQNKIRGDRYILVAEIDLTDYLQLSTKPIAFTELKVFPTVVRDITLKLDEKTAIGQLIASIINAKINYLDEIKVIDTYKDKEIMSITLRLGLYAPDHTLTDIEINKSLNKIKNILNK